MKKNFYKNFVLICLCILLILSGNTISFSATNPTEISKQYSTVKPEIISESDNSTQYYYIQSKHSGKNLNILNDSNSEGAQVVQFSPTGKDSQIMCLIPCSNDPGYYLIQVKSSSYYLNVSSDKATDNIKVIQYHNTGGDNQEFKFTPCSDAPGYYNIQVKSSSLNLDIYKNQTSDNCNVIQYHNTGGDNQKFKLIAANIPDTIDPFISYSIEAKQSGLTLGVYGNSMTESAGIVQYHNTGYDSQKVFITKNAEDHDYIFIKLKSSKLYFGANNANEGTKILQYKYSGLDSQKFKLIPCKESPGYYNIQIKQGSLNLNVLEDPPTEEAQVVQYHDTGKGCQQFQLIVSGGISPLFEYQNAVTDSMTIEPEEILPLVTLTKDSNMTEEINGITYVQLITWNNNFQPDSSGTNPPSGQSIDLKDYRPKDVVWMFTADEMVNWYKKNCNIGIKDWNLRFKELIGLPMNTNKTCFTSVLVPIYEIKRPAYSYNVSQQLQISDIYFKPSASKNFVKWFNKNIVDSYFSPSQYPWTRLGYTYDWAYGSEEYGLSEFILDMNTYSKVIYEFSKTTDQFIDWLNSTSTLQ